MMKLVTYAAPPTTGACNARPGRPCHYIYALSACCLCALCCAGKTVVYALPLICIALQDEIMMPLESGEGPLGLIICPSRELANQTVEVITQFTDAIKAVRV